MTITRAGLAGGSFADAATQVDHSVGTVSVGQLVVFKVSGLNLSGASDPPVAGDCTKVAGTATIGAISLDRQSSGQTGPGPEWSHEAIYSCIVTGAGTLTLRYAGAPSGSYLWAASEAYNATGGWDSSRVDGTPASAFDATNNATSATTGSISNAAAGGLMVGGLCLTNGVDLAITPDGAWNQLAEQESAAHIQGSFIDRINTGAVTDDASWTFPALDGGGYAGTACAAVAYKEVAGGGGSSILRQMMAHH